MSYLAYVDKTLTCRECGKDFTFTAAEQEGFVQKGFVNEPGRCSDCRAARKSRLGSAGDGERTMSNRGGAGSYGRGPREMFAATCSACGQTAQLPFQPRSDKPVYCSSCFEQQRGSR